MCSHPAEGEENMLAIVFLCKNIKRVKKGGGTRRHNAKIALYLEWQWHAPTICSQRLSFRKHVEVTEEERGYRRRDVRWP